MLRYEEKDCGASSETMSTRQPINRTDLREELLSTALLQ